MPLPLMPKATAVWLIENTSLTFEQIGAFCGLHHLEVQAIADGDVIVGMMGRDPIASGELTFEELKRCAADPTTRLVISTPSSAAPPPKKKAKYIPLARRLDKPAAILWLTTEHPELTDKQIMKLISTTQVTVTSVRNGTHKSFADLKPDSPVKFGLCTQAQLDEVTGPPTKAS